MALHDTFSLASNLFCKYPRRSLVIESVSSVQLAEGEELDEERQKRKAYEVEWLACQSVIQAANSVEPVAIDVCTPVDEDDGKTRALLEEELLGKTATDLERESLKSYSSVSCSYS